MGRRTPLLALLLVAVGCHHQPTPQPALRSAGLELLLQTEAQFYRDDRLCADAIVDGQPTAHAAHCWPASMHLSALCAAAKVDRSWRRRLDEYITAMDAHRPAGGGYDASAYPPKPDRYHDDNAWMALALLEAYGLSGDAEHLARAKTALSFALAGEDSTLGGGIWWRESERKSKHACSVAPTIVACLRMYRIGGDRRYLESAERLTEWIEKTLRDPADGLYFDHVRIDGTIDRVKFSYNSALMIAARCAWFDVTDDLRHLGHARRIADAATRRWVVLWPMAARGAIRDDAFFAAWLVEALLELYRRDGDSRWHAAAVAAVTFVARRNADPAGWRPAKWDAIPTAPLRTVRLIDQSAAVRAMLLTDIIR